MLLILNTLIYVSGSFRIKHWHNWDLWHFLQIASPPVLMHIPPRSELFLLLNCALQQEDEKVAVRLGIGEYQTVPKHLSPNWLTQEKNSSKRIITLFFIITRQIKEDFNHVLCPLHLWHCCRLESVKGGLFPFCFLTIRGLNSPSSCPRYQLLVLIGFGPWLRCFCLPFKLH